jgi:hypothetical protein
MADLTVLSSLTPIPVYPSRPRSGFTSRNPSYTGSSSRVNLSLLKEHPGPSRPTLSRLDLSKGKEREGSSGPSSRRSSEDSDSAASNASTSSIATSPQDGEGTSCSQSPEEDREAQTPRQPYYTDRSTDMDIISPIPRISSHPRPTHRPTRSQSAPPERTTFVSDEDTITPRSMTHNGILYTYPKIPNSAGFSEPRGSRRLRGKTHTLEDSGSTSSSSGSPVSAWSYDSPTRRHGGELVRPPPPLRMCPFFIYPIISILPRNRPTNNFLATDTAFGCYLLQLLPFYPFDPTLHLHRCWPQL